MNVALTFPMFNKLGDINIDIIYIDVMMNTVNNTLILHHCNLILILKYINVYNPSM